MRWQLSYRADQVSRRLADRHYSRQSIGSKQFVPPGRCFVLRIGNPAKALWVTSWPFQEYVKHAWAGAWMCSMFRNEGAGLSSELIREAVAATKYNWPDIPPLGMVTFVDTKKVNSRNPGYCYKHAGFKRVGETKSGLVALQLLPKYMPAAAPAIGIQESLFEAAVA